MNTPQIHHSKKPNEWDLQEAATLEWSLNGVHSPELGHLRLVAWEVMFPSWHINEHIPRPGRGWQPSVDFVLLTEANELVLVEMKPRLTCGVARSAFIQVSHRAILATKSFSTEHLLQAFNECLDGAAERSFPAGFNPQEIAERVRQCDPQKKVHRVLTSATYRDDALELIQSFNTMNYQSLLERLISESASKPNVSLFSDISPSAFDELQANPAIYLPFDGKQPSKTVVTA